MSQQFRGRRLEIVHHSTDHGNSDLSAERRAGRARRTTYRTGRPVSRPALVRPVMPSQQAPPRQIRRRKVSVQGSDYLCDIARPPFAVSQTESGAGFPAPDCFSSSAFLSDDGAEL